MTKKNIFLEDLEAKKPKYNLAVNRACADLVKNDNYDLIARVYRHTKGVILGNGESSEDVDLDFCEKEGYDVVSRPSGGSAIIVNSDLNLCYSLFFNSKRFGGRFNIHPIYESITIPLARNLGEDFSVEGTYYLRYSQNGERFPIAGHAIKSYGDVIQFDGVINLRRFDMSVLERVLRLRELWEYNGEKYIKVNEKFYDLRGNEIGLPCGSANLLRSEKNELEKIKGLEELGISIKDFSKALRKTCENVFGVVEDFSEDSLNLREIDSNQKNKNRIGGKKRNLGHCFVDLIEEEPKIVYDPSKS